jgi:hypothetical protein
LTFTSASSSDGITFVSAGTLTFSAGATLAGGRLVNVGAQSGIAPVVLGGSGTISGTVQLFRTGVISPGTSAGNLTLQNGLSCTPGSQYRWELNQNTTIGGGVNWDRISVTGGSVSVNPGAIFLPSFIGTATVPNGVDSFWQTTQTWDNVILAGTINSATFSIDNSAWSTFGSFSTFASGSGISLLWTPVPEPACVLALCGAGLLVWRRIGR